MTMWPTRIDPLTLAGVECVTNAVYPAATINWVLNEENITAGITNRTVADPGGGVITISRFVRNYTVADSGKILVCTATSINITVTSKPLTLFVTGRSRFHIYYVC